MEEGGQGKTGRETSKSHRDLAGGGRGGRAALSSYRQSGGANSTRKTWGALVGETGRSHLTSTLTLGHSLEWRVTGRGGHGNIFKAAGKETHRKSWPRRHLLLASVPEEWLRHQQRRKQPPAASSPAQVFPSLSESPCRGRSPSCLLPDLRGPPGQGLPGSKMAPTSLFCFSSKESIYSSSRLS